ncbi:hypothetical protein [Plantactinospora sp. KLBMP9567]|uniref:hypothetical protein n=1 Tax=Plantactinospora sp. KLBMP9567 TaxID=3085900 RepID=UPI0029810E32|nr:hypothetical protein [Plantactinospora sp. KLBMP9567]MDW5325491.1 hypothetical protein [Plantactinospora sp. KLBMP9567]
MAPQWTQRWGRRLGVTVCGVLVLAGCTEETGPEPPAPKVTAQEVEQRLTEHLSRAVNGALEPEAQATAPTRSRTVGCGDLPGGGPTWGVRPRAELTVSAGERAGKYLDDVDTWMIREGFGERTKRWRVDTPADVQEITGEHDDGTELLMEMARDSGKFTVGLTGPCTWPPDRPGGPPSSGQLPPLPAPSGPTSTRSEDSVDPCRSPKLYVYNLTSRPFAGRGPHLMAMVGYSDEKEMEYAEILLPRAWEPRYEPGTSERNLDQVQLLVCVRVAATRDSRQDVTCNYASEQALLGGGRPFTFDLFESVYRVTVREARSGKVVSEFTVPGRQGAEDSCPFRMNYNRKLARGIDETAFQRKLRPLVEARR